MGPKSKPGQGQKQRKKMRSAKKVPNDPGERKRRKREHMERRRAERALKDQIDLRKLSNKMRELKRKCYGEESDIRPLPENERLIAVAPASKRTQQCIRALATLHGLRVQARSKASTSKRRRVLHVTPPVPGILGKTAAAALRDKSPSWEQVETLVLIYEGKINKFAKGRGSRALGSKGEIRVDQDLIQFVFGGTSFGKHEDEAGAARKETRGSDSRSSSDCDSSDSSDDDDGRDSDDEGEGEGKGVGKGRDHVSNDKDEERLVLELRDLRLTNGDALWKGGLEGGKGEHTGRGARGEDMGANGGYKWERHSTGIGRQLMMKMGFGAVGDVRNGRNGTLAAKRRSGNDENDENDEASQGESASGAFAAAASAIEADDKDTDHSSRNSASRGGKKNKSRAPLVLFHKAGLGATGSGITEAITLEDTGGRLPGAGAGTKGRRKGRRGKRQKDLGGDARRGLGYKGP